MSVEEIEKFCICHAAKAFDQALCASEKCKNKTEMYEKYPDEYLMLQILTPGYWANRMRCEAAHVETKQKKEVEKKEPKPLTLEVKKKWLRTPYSVKSPSLFLERCKELLDGNIFLTDVIIRNLQSIASIQQEVKDELIQRSNILKERTTKERIEKYISNDYVANPDRLVWTKEACLAKVCEFVEEGRTTQDLRHMYRRCYEVIYSRYRFMLNMFPGYRSKVDHKGHANKSKCNDTRTIITHFEGTREEFEEAYPHLMPYIFQTKSLKKNFEGHFRCHPKKPTLSVSQRSIPGYGVVDEKGQYRAIYVYWYDGDDKVKPSAYVGLAKDLAKRDREHNGMSRIHNDKIAYYKHVLGIQWNYKVLTEFLPEQEAQQAEAHWERHYRNLGYEMLNAAPCGSLGGSGFKKL